MLFFTNESVYTEGIINSSMIVLTKWNIQLIWSQDIKSPLYESLNHS